MTGLRAFMCAATTAVAMLCGLPGALADDCIAAGEGVGDYFEISGSCTTPPGSSNPPSVGGDSSADPYVKYQWASICTLDPKVQPSDVECVAALSCADPQQRLWQLWGELPNGSWRVIRSECFGGKPPPYKPPKVTPAMVLSALRRVGLPPPTVHVQPAGKTLVNFDTIFWTEPQPVDLNLTILGQSVEVEADPTSYRWVFGDGAETTTTDPGRPYPHKDVTHRYADAEVTEPHVEAVYTARFRVGAGDWQDIDETVTVPGPVTDLRIVEGTPLLTGGH